MKMFDIDTYYRNLEQFIKTIFERNEKDLLSYDILDSDCIIEEYKIALRIKHYQMKKGEIWQEAIGTYDGFRNLKVGHNTGLDAISDNKMIAIELKNRTNTDNASARKANFDKLAKFKKENSSYCCVYATINDTTEEKTQTGFRKVIIHNDVEIEHLSGLIFLQTIFGEHTNDIINFIRLTINKYRC